MLDITSSTGHDTSLRVLSSAIPHKCVKSNVELVTDVCDMDVAVAVVVVAVVVLEVVVVLKGL